MFPVGTWRTGADSTQRTFRQFSEFLLARGKFGKHPEGFSFIQLHMTDILGGRAIDCQGY